MKGNTNRNRSSSPESRLSKKNLVMPKTDKVTIYRAEARPNQRLYVGDDIKIYGKKKQEKIIQRIKKIIEENQEKGKERSADEVVEQITKEIKEKEAKKMLFIGIDNPERAEDFMSQSRLRERKKDIQFLQNSIEFLKKLSEGFSKYNDRQLEMPFDAAVHLMHAIHLFKRYLFDAHGQTIRTSVISKDIAENLILQSMTERCVTNSEEIPYITFTKKEGEQYYVPKKLSNKRELSAHRDVLNVDVTKSYNQFGITCDMLVQFMKEIEENGVSEGLTYKKRSRSLPKYLEKRILEQPSDNEKTEDMPSQSTSQSNGEARQSWLKRIKMEEKKRFDGKIDAHYSSIVNNMGVK